MTFDEFYRDCRDIAKDYTKGDGYLDDTEWKSWKEPSVKKHPRLFVEWETGGCSGGNCWGGTAEPYSCDDPPKELDILDEILGKLCPSIPFLVYKQLKNDLVKEDTNCSDCGDYYGNYTNYRTLEVDLKELYDYLIQNELIK